MARHGRGLRRMKPSPPLMHSSANFLALIGQRKDPTADVHHGFSVPPRRQSAFAVALAKCVPTYTIYARVTS